MGWRSSPPIHLLCVVRNCPDTFRPAVLVVRQFSRQFGTKRTGAGRKARENFRVIFVTNDDGLGLLVNIAMRYLLSLPLAYLSCLINLIIFAVLCVSCLFPKKKQNKFVLFVCFSKLFGSCQQTKPLLAAQNATCNFGSRTFLLPSNLGHSLSSFVAHLEFSCDEGGLERADIRVLSILCILQPDEREFCMKSVLHDSISDYPS